MRCSRLGCATDLHQLRAIDDLRKHDLPENSLSHIKTSEMRASVHIPLSWGILKRRSLRECNQANRKGPGAYRSSQPAPLGPCAHCHWQASADGVARIAWGHRSEDPSPSASPTAPRPTSAGAHPIDVGSGSLSSSFLQFGGLVAANSLFFFSFKRKQTNSISKFTARHVCFESPPPAPPPPLSCPRIHEL